MLDYINKYLSHIEHDRNFSQQTLRAYRNDLHQYLSFLNAEGCSGFGDVTRLLLRKFLAFQKNKLILKPPLPGNSYLSGLSTNFYVVRVFWNSIPWRVFELLN